MAGGLSGEEGCLSAFCHIHRISLFVNSCRFYSGVLAAAAPMDRICLVLVAERLLMVLDMLSTASPAFSQRPSLLRAPIYHHAIFTFALRTPYHCSWYTTCNTQVRFAALTLPHWLRRCTASSYCALRWRAPRDSVPTTLRGTAHINRFATLGRYA